MKVSFLGAAGTVTGSRFLLETDSVKILVDCGLFQERAFQKRNWERFPVDPYRIDAVLLTHAHIDHCGYLPKLVKEGFSGPVFCTEPTADIAGVSLLDAAKLQEADAEFKKRRHKREGRKGPFPEAALFTVDDARDAGRLFKTVSYGEDVELPGGMKARFFDAGHILGSAMIEVTADVAGKTRTIVFSGDIGRWDRPLLKDPHLFERADYVIMEGTYGARVHESEDNGLSMLETVINETHQRNGNIVIPSFAIERTQDLLYDLNFLLNEDRIPHLMTFVDSPMAIEVTKAFERHTDYFDAEAQKRLEQDPQLFRFPTLKMTPTVRQSKAINHIKGTAVIIAGSGMCNGGRIKHHLVNNISRPESTILFVGYQARGTLGRQILDRPDEVRIHGETRPVRARIESVDGFSAHAGQDELLRWATAFQSPPRKICIVHAEPESAGALAGLLRVKTSSEVVIPDYLDHLDIEA